MKSTRIRQITMLFLTAILTVAFANFASAQSDDSSVAKAQFEKGIKLYDEKKYDEAIPLFKEVIRLAPNAFPGYFGLGASYLMLKQWSEAEQNLQRAVDLMPNNEAVSEMAEETREMLKFAREQYAIQKRQQPPTINEQAAPFAAQGSQYFEAKDFKKAVKAFAEAAKLDPNNWSIHYNLAAAYFNSKQYTKSRNAYRKVLELNPNHPSAAADLADAEKKMAEEKAEQAAFMAKLNNALEQTGENLRNVNNGGGGNNSSSDSSTSSSPKGSAPGSLPTGTYACYESVSMRIGGSWSSSRQTRGTLTIHDNGTYSGQGGNSGRYSYNAGTGEIRWLSGVFASEEFNGGEAIVNKEGGVQINVKINALRNPVWDCTRE